MLHCVILNASFEPLDVVSAQAAIVMVLKGKAKVSEEHPKRRFRTVRQEYPWPTEVILLDYCSAGPKYHKPAQLNQRNLFVRDNLTCVYCGRHQFELAPTEVLTRDHVHPRGYGGEDIWENVVTACSTCNHTKDNHTFDEIRRIIAEYQRRINKVVREEMAAGVTEEAALRTKRAQELLAEQEPYTHLREPQRPPRAPTVHEIKQKAQQRVRRRVGD